LIEGDVAAGVAALKLEDGGDLLVAGSRTLVHTLIDYNLVDEYRLMIFPVVLGRRTSVPRATGEGRAEAGRHEGVRLRGSSSRRTTPPDPLEPGSG